MHCSLFRQLLVVCLLAAGTPVRAEVSVVDDSGATISLAQPAKRIVSLAPHLTETLFAAGAGERIVGTVEYSEYPPAASRIARVGGYSRIDLERVAALRPDLIIAWQSGNAAAHLDRLRGLAIPIYLSQPNHLADVAGEIERLGVLAGSRAVANRAAENFASGSQACRSATAAVRRYAPSTRSGNSR
jgi:iron complex transport system substrate-binding protein